MSINIKSAEYGPKTFLGLKYNIKISEITTSTEIYDQAYTDLSIFFQKSGIEPTGPSAFIYTYWNDEEDKTIVVICYEVLPEDAQDAESKYEIIEVPKSQAYIAEVVGDYGQLKEAHQKTAQQLKGLEHTFTIESYRAMGENSEENVTDVIYTYK